MGNIPLNENVYVFKVGNTSFSFVRHGDIRSQEATSTSQLLKIEQRTGPRTENEQEKHAKVANDKRSSKECRLDDVKRSSDRRHPSTRRESSSSSFSSKRNDTSIRSSRGSKVKR